MIGHVQTIQYQRRRQLFQVGGAISWGFPALHTLAIHSICKARRVFYLVSLLCDEQNFIGKEIFLNDKKLQMTETRS